MLEKDFQSNLIKKIKKKWPNCIILKNDPNYIQGFPDLTILEKNHWVILEVKQNEYSERQPNQEFYISKTNDMSYAKFIFPENHKEVLNEMEQLFKS